MVDDSLVQKAVIFAINKARSDQIKHVSRLKSEMLVEFDEETVHTALKMIYQRLSLLTNVN